MKAERHYILMAFLVWYKVSVQDGRLWKGTRSMQEQDIFRFAEMDKATTGPTQPPILQIPGAISLGVRRPRREADSSLPSRADIKHA